MVKKTPFIIGGIAIVFFIVLVIFRIQHPLVGGGFYSVQNNLTQSASTTPGGATTQVQSNQAGLFSGSANFTWDNVNSRLGINTTTQGSSFTVDNGDVYIASSTKGEIRKLPNGNCLRYTVDNTCATVTSTLTCPS